MPTLSALRDPHVVLARLGGRDRLVRAIEVVIVVLLACQAARLAWLLLPPAPPTSAAADLIPRQHAEPARLSIDAFHPRRDATTPADTSGLRLFAVRPAATGGSAILALRDGPQRSHAVGEEVAPGVVLAGVQADHVLLDDGGSRHALHFVLPEGTPVRVPAPVTPATAGASAALRSAAPAAVAPVPEVDPAALLGAMGLRPEETDGRVAGYTVVPRGNDAVLRQAGLQAGDVLLSVNNEALDAERHAALAETLGRASTITFTYRRDGQIRSATLQAPTP
ncbi:type II secretion system protein N [Luteimonas sp. MC1895]|uniref:type II secretion system protein N n=1 Tax=Luteimonas sp. MC1895 TaxID=2819513 RepID=UPI0018F0E3ED|nr:type II secretion system protein N [Luteimonas sp. MC1895]MBJ6978307.1 type II secretion system protein C [Luteimonas sp. MC1895]